MAGKASVSDMALCGQKTDAWQQQIQPIRDCLLAEGWIPDCLQQQNTAESVLYFR